MTEIDETELIGALRAGNVVQGAGVQGAAVQGTGVQGAARGGRRSVPAELLRRCCHELRDQVDPRGLQLSQVVVTGRLDLAGLTVPFPLRFDGCEFDTAPVVDGAQLYELSLTGCPGSPACSATG